MKKAFLLTFLLGSFWTLPAQKQLFIEPALLEVHYSHSMQEDTVRKGKTKQDSMILRIGKNHSQFFSYFVFLEDSMMNNPKAKKKAEDLKIKAFETGDFSKFPGRHTTSDYIYKNYPHNKITVTTQRLIAGFFYKDEYLPQEWTIWDSTKLILNYSCQFAVCNFRGRQWCAWFTTDIPVSEGPWKLNGLPGLILEAYDKNKDYYYLATGIKEKSIVAVTFYDFSGKGFIATDRLTFLNAKYNYLRGVSTEEIDLIKDVYWGGKKINYSMQRTPRRLLYDFQELDYK